MQFSVVRRRIVIDTDVVCAAGVVHTGDVRPAMCGRFLSATRDHGHYVVITDEMLLEWRRRQSRFSSSWLTSMFARRQVQRVVPVPVRLQPAMASAGLTAKEQRACEKDLHLIEAAIATDRRIASLDETARDLLRRVAAMPEGKTIASVHWINPERPAEDALAWLAVGAPADLLRTLGAT
jgi:hypothetical protein